MNNLNTAISDKPTSMNSPRLGDYVESDRVLSDLCVSSRKRLFEELSVLISNTTDLSRDCVFRTLTDRERLGCTSIGEGVAVPHGRIAGIDSPIVAICRLETPIDYDAFDDKPIWLAVVLIVPEEATETHLQLLASLAQRLGEAEVIHQIQALKNESEIYDFFKTI